jgi:hypothetical protein
LVQFRFGSVFAGPEGRFAVALPVAAATTPAAPSPPPSFARLIARRTGFMAGLRRA